MKKLTKTLLALAAAATMALSAQSAFAQVYFNETFEDDNSYNDTIAMARGGGALWSTVENPDGEGKVLSMDLTANGGLVNATITDALLKDSAAITAGRVTFSADVYIPETLGNEDVVKLTANHTDGSAAAAVIIANSGTSNGNTAYFTNYPVGEWFTIEWDIDYSEKSGVVNAIIDGEAYTIKNAFNASVSKGLTGFRLTGERKAGAELKVYFDNVKYYDNPKPLAPMTETVWFNIDPEVTGVNSFAAGLVAQGGASGGSTTTDGYCEATGTKALYVNAPGVYHLDNCRTDANPYQHFANRTSGIQYIDYKMYIHEDGISEGGAINIQIRHTGKAVRAAVKLVAPDSTTATSTALNAAVAKAIYNEEFTVRFIWNYVSRCAAAYIIREDGTWNYVGYMAINENDNYKADGFRITNEKCKYYITGIKYYDAANMPNMINFDDGAYTAGGKIDAAGMLVQTITGSNGTYLGIAVDNAPGEGAGKAVKMTSKASTNADADAAVKFESYFLAMNAGEDIVTASIDLYFPEALKDTEILTYQPLTSGNGKIPGKNTGLASGEKWEGIIGDQCILQGEYVGVANSELTEKYPVGEWFTLTIVYDSVLKEKTEYMIKADGTVVEIAKSKLIDDNLESLKNYGVKAHRVHLARKAGTEVAAEKSFYIDNMKISSLNISDSSLEYDRREECWSGIVNYEANGDVLMPTNIIMAAYNSDGDYVGCTILENDTFYDGLNSYMADIPVDEEGEIADVKMMFIDSVNGLKPYLPVAIAE